MASFFLHPFFWWSYNWARGPLCMGVSTHLWEHTPLGPCGFLPTTLGMAGTKVHLLEKQALHYHEKREIEDFRLPLF